MMRRTIYIVIMTLSYIAAYGSEPSNRRVEQYDGSKLTPHISLDSALRAGMVDFSDCEIIDAAVIKYDQRGDTALHETVGDTRRDFIVRGDSLWLFRQEWWNRFIHATTPVKYHCGIAAQKFEARLREHQSVHSQFSGMLSSRLGLPQTLVIAPGDTVRNAVAHIFSISGDLGYTDYNYQPTDTLCYPVELEISYWYAPDGRHPAAVWERYCYLGQGQRYPQYDKLYIFPTYENRSVPPAAYHSPAIVAQQPTLEAIDGSDLVAAISGNFDESDFRATVDITPATSEKTRVEITPYDTGHSYRLLLCNVSGQLIWHGECSPSNSAVCNLPPGYYIAALRDKDRQTVTYRKFRVGG